MDHSWGRNIAAAGLIGVGASMAARVLPPFDQYYITNLVRDGDFYDVLVPLPATDDPYTYQAWIKQAENFPYYFGEFVEPDGPV